MKHIASVSWGKDSLAMLIYIRVSCWCCANKNLKELRNVYKYLPQYWERLKNLQSQLERPMKKYVKNGIPYGNVFDMEKVFEKEMQEERI